MIQSDCVRVRGVRDGQLLQFDRVIANPPFSQTYNGKVMQSKAAPQNRPNARPAQWAGVGGENGFKHCFG